MIRALCFAASLATAGCATTPRFQVVVELQCTAQGDGFVTDCEAINSTSADPAFAEAAIRASERAKVVVRQGQQPQDIRFKIKFWEHPDNAIQPS